MIPSDLRLAEMAELAYRGPWDWTGEGHTRAMCFQEDGYTTIAFEGTTLDGLAILRDIRFLPIWHHRIGVVPAGFGRGLIDIMDKIEIDLTAAAKSGVLCIVGHSLGGALAEECAGWFSALGYPPVKVLSLEPPYSGSRRLQRLMHAVPIKRAVRCGNSPVTCVPRIWGLYRHPIALDWIGAPQADPLACHKIAFIRHAMADAPSAIHP